MAAPLHLDEAQDRLRGNNIELHPLRRCLSLEGLLASREMRTVISERPEEFLLEPVKEPSQETRTFARMMVR
jgi:hypothetical protein